MNGCKPELESHAIEKAVLVRFGYGKLMENKQLEFWVYLTHVGPTHMYIHLKTIRNLCKRFPLDFIRLPSKLFKDFYFGAFGNLRQSMETYR